MYVETASLNGQPQSAQATVGIVAGPLLAATPGTNGVPGTVAHQKCYVRALSTNTASVFVGGPGVTTATGLELPANAAIDLPIADPSKLFAVSGTAGQKVALLWV